MTTQDQVKKTKLIYRIETNILSFPKFTAIDLIFSLRFVITIPNILENLK